MDKPLLRLNHPSIRTYFHCDDAKDVGLLIRERLVIHMLKSGSVKRGGGGEIYRYQGSLVHEPDHFRRWENQLRPYPDTPIDWKVAYG